MTDLPVVALRKTLRQTAVILNVSEKTVRRYLDTGRLQWAGNQVSVESIVLLMALKKRRKVAGPSHGYPMRVTREAQKRASVRQKKIGLGWSNRYR